MFRTEINLPASENKISLATPILSIGSCFAQIIGEKLKANKFDIIANPFGVIFNPLSVFELIQMAVRKEMPSEASYLENQHIHYNYCFHSDISATRKEELIEKSAAVIRQVHEQLKKAEWMMITFGTAFVYRRKDTQEIVANCHKMPDSHFERELLEPEAIIYAFDQMLAVLAEINPRIRYILTVSPVRHIRDGLPKNSVSKAILRYVCEKLITRHDAIDYFPSYELFMDDLRDYRFYAADMVHPNEVFEKYVWDKFIHRYLDDGAQTFIKEWSKISKALEHRPFYPGSPSHQEFLKKTLGKLELLSSQVDVKREMEWIKKELSQ